MSSKSKKKPDMEKKKVAPAEVAPAEVAPAEVAPAEVTPAEVTHPSLKLMSAILTGWRMNHLSQFYYKITRTFAHHRLNEGYDPSIIFKQFDLLNCGDHAALVEEMESFGKDIMHQLAQHIAEKEQDR